MLFFIILSKPCTPRQGKTKVEVAKMIQATKDDVVIKYNKLHADPKQGDTHCTFKKKTPPHVANPSCCSTRQNAGSDPEEGETQDDESSIADKYKYKYTITDANTNTNVKVKHKMVENMTSSTADALGLSRAILCNDR